MWRASYSFASPKKKKATFRRFFRQFYNLKTHLYLVKMFM